MHRFTLEVGRQGALAMGSILQRLVTVCTEGTGERGERAEDALEGLVKDVGHLVLYEAVI